jgi:hypothetical protein
VTPQRVYIVSSAPAPVPVPVSVPIVTPYSSYPHVGGYISNNGQPPQQQQQQQVIFGQGMYTAAPPGGGITSSIQSNQQMMYGYPPQQQPIVYAQHAFIQPTQQYSAQYNVPSYSAMVSSQAIHYQSQQQQQQQQSPYYSPKPPIPPSSGELPALAPPSYDAAMITTAPLSNVAKDGFVSVDKPLA